MIVVSRYYERQHMGDETYADANSAKQAARTWAQQGENVTLRRASLDPKVLASYSDGSPNNGGYTTTVLMYEGVAP